MPNSQKSPATSPAQASSIVLFPNTGEHNITPHEVNTPLTAPPICLYFLIASSIIRIPTTLPIRITSYNVCYTKLLRTTRQSCPSALIAAGNEPATSASPPEAIKGTASLDAYRIFIISHPFFSAFLYVRSLIDQNWIRKLTCQRLIFPYCNIFVSNCKANLCFFTNYGVLHNY